jgi:hypothetical protein
MRKTKYLAIFAVAAMFLAVLAGTGSNVGGDMYDWDGVKHPVYQTNDPPVIDGVVEVGLTWPVEAFIGHTYIANQGGGIPTTDVYMLFDNLAGYTNPDGFDPEDEQGYYFYIGIKALEGYSIDIEGNWLVIDWDQDGIIDFADHNGNSAGSGNNQGYSTQYARTCGQGVEWAIPYLDDFDGICQSPFYITIHIEIVLPCGGGTETTTFPDRPPGPFLSTEICVGDQISPEPPEPGEWGIRTIGFWKHQFNTALGYKNGHNHVPYENLQYYVSVIASESTVPELQALDADLMEALAILELKGKHTMYDKAVQQLLATWLNFVSDGDQEVSVDGDDIPDMLLSEAIEQIELIITNPNATHDELEYAKNMADNINNSGEE